LASDCYRFQGFELDPGDRQLRLDGASVELNTRYLDALVLLVREQGKLVSKERFLQEVWRGVPVTDEALTQCIKTLRRALRDDAGSPRFIETVPKHGYRFIAMVEGGETARPDGRDFLSVGVAGMVGGAAAGFIGGLFYGVMSAAQSGTISALFVLACVSALVGLAAGGGVGFGVAAAGVAAPRESVWTIAGAAAGGLLIGAFVKLIGVDTLAFLFGRAPGDIAGAPEGLLLGGATGCAIWLAHRATLPRALALGGVAGGAAGVAIELLGGRLMAGSLDQLAQNFPESRLHLDPIGALFGERGLGATGLALTSALEGALFALCMVAALTFAQGRRGPKLHPEPARAA
jgi:DNA-binding winged helix-turn-helix (wHTH) protein